MREGEAWDCWVKRLTEVFKQSNLPTHARKDADKIKPAGRYSPFVALVWELQNLVPVQFRRHLASHAALARAIYVSRKL